MGTCGRCSNRELSWGVVPILFQATKATLITGQTQRNVVNPALLRGLLPLVPACVLFAGSIILFFSRKTVGYSLQLIGAGCLVVVALTHTFEAFHVFPWMHWGFEHSVGHYIDFWSAMLGFTLFPIGYFLHALTPDSKRCS
jgi:hypothetical protein